MLFFIIVIIIDMVVRVFGFGFMPLSRFLRFVYTASSFFALDSYEIADTVAWHNLSYSVYKQFNILV